MANPIWKDYFVSLGTADSIQYRISLNDTGEIIYTGRSFKRPGETNNQIKINDVCADYITSVLPNLSQAEFTLLSLPLSFKVEKYSGSSWSSVGVVEFLNDWSYDYAYNVATMGMAFPINGRIDKRQWLTYTAYNASSITATLTFADGTTSQVIIPVAISNDFNNDFNDDFSRSVRSAGSGTAVFDLSAWQNVVKVTIGGKTWNVVTDCADYALYYVNAYGGWDSLLIEGNTQVRDEITRHTRGVVYDNRDIKNRGQQNYVNELAPSLTMHTGWMSDNESSRMHHLMSSTNVYMWDFLNSQMIPVTIVNTTCEHKTYKSNGGRLVNYDIEVAIAQNRVRR